MGTKGKKNAYVCGKCGRVIITKDIDQGVTPFGIRCRLLVEGKPCNGTATSKFYQLTEAEQAAQPKYHWYRPKEVRHLSRPEREHVKQGGLLLRPAKQSTKLTLEQDRRSSWARKRLR